MTAAFVRRVRACGAAARRGTPLTSPLTNVRVPLLNRERYSRLTTSPAGSRPTARGATMTGAPTAYTVDFKTVSTVGLESSPVASALAGLRANEARYFKNKYDHDFTDR